MPYAIMQKDLEPPPVERLKQAFCTLPSLTALDAQTAANDAFGILMRGLDVEPASNLQDALLKVGVDTLVLEENDLPVIPPAKLVRQMEFEDAHLIMYDPMGRSFKLAWRDVLLLAAGNVRAPDHRKPRSGVEPPHSSGLGEGRGKESEPHHLQLEIVLTGGIARYSVTAADFVFNHLGTRLTPSLLHNFTLLVRDLAEYAPHAGMNRGAFGLCQPEMSVVNYPSKAAFFEELTWMLWRIGVSLG